MAQDATPPPTFTSPSPVGQATTCQECGSVVLPDGQATHVAWHQKLRAEAGTWVIPTGIAH